jgi:hypothetical protein
MSTHKMALSNFADAPIWQVDMYNNMDVVQCKYKMIYNDMKCLEIYSPNLGAEKSLIQCPGLLAPSQCVSKMAAWLLLSNINTRAGHFF